MNGVETTVVGRRRHPRTAVVQAHIQILRIRAEDLRLGEDVGEGNKRWFKDGFCAAHFMHMLPASPLGAKTVNSISLTTGS